MWICFHITEVHTKEGIHWCQGVIVNRLSGLMKRKQRKQKMAFPKSNVCISEVVHSVWPILAWFVTLPMKTANYHSRSTPQLGKEQAGQKSQESYPSAQSLIASAAFSSAIALGPPKGESPVTTCPVTHLGSHCSPHSSTGVPPSPGHRFSTSESHKGRSTSMRA